jgi:hypothetical protein
VTGTSLYQLDTVNPDINEYTTTTPTNLLATNAQNFSFNYANSAGGSPVRITSGIEDWNNPVLWISVFNPSVYAYTHNSNQDIHIVDGADRIADGFTARQYSYRVTSLCDQAGNCAIAGFPRLYNYNVYSNPNSTVNNTFSSV